jgi:hypothetical protein
MMSMYIYGVWSAPHCTLPLPFPISTRGLHPFRPMLGACDGATIILVGSRSSVDPQGMRRRKKVRIWNRIGGECVCVSYFSLAYSGVFAIKRYHVLRLEVEYNNVRVRTHRLACSQWHLVDGATPRSGRVTCTCACVCARVLTYVRACVCVRAVFYS